MAKIGRSLSLVFVLIRRLRRRLLDLDLSRLGTRCTEEVEIVLFGVLDSDAMTVRVLPSITLVTGYAVRAVILKIVSDLSDGPWSDTYQVLAMNTADSTIEVPFTVGFSPFL